MRPFADPIRSVTTMVSMKLAVGLERYNFNWSKTNIVTLLIKYFDLLNKFISFLWKISQHNIFLIKFIQNPCPPQPWLKLHMYCMYCKNKPCYAGVAAYDTSDFLGNMQCIFNTYTAGGGVHPHHHTVGKLKKKIFGYIMKYSIYCTGICFEKIEKLFFKLL